MSYKIFEYDPYLKPFENDIEQRMLRYKNKKKELLGDNMSLLDFANGHEYFGFHKAKEGWYYREWAPGADAMYIMGDMNGWNPTGIPMTKKGNGTFEVLLKDENALYHGCKVKAVVEKDGQRMERIPLYARRVVQDPVNYSWAAEIVDEQPYKWKKKKFAPNKNLFIYECHVGMAQEKEGIGSYAEFTENILPRIKELGYNCIQIMAIMEHPYYGSFGYQVSSFFAASSRYGLPNDLKKLIDTAHGMGIAVLLDVVHSHA
ncbi:MAG: 1,4-alpha-glucan-branching enzyme, partial [Oscillospiraceae bacterium]|nr:1,4-alpha-glucan-branching enzyme [Oscillospiraceae bacterium]